MCGVNGKKFPSIRAHQKKAVTKVYGLDTNMETFPADGRVDPKAYIGTLLTTALLTSTTLY